MNNYGDAYKNLLKNIAQEKNVDVASIQKRYVNERILGRLENSKWANKFGLKGAMMIVFWNEGKSGRPTVDIDLFGNDDTEDDRAIDKIKEMVLDITSMSPQSEGGTLPYNDGLNFLQNTLSIKKDRDGITSGGKVSIKAQLGKSIIDVFIDVGFGNAITPDPKFAEFPSLLSDHKTKPLPKPKIMVYPAETTIAEKFHANVQFGLFNTRIRDYFDLYYLFETQSFDNELLGQAIANTFRRQEREIPEELDGLSDFYVMDKEKDWDKYVKNTQLNFDTPSFEKVVETIRKKLEEPILIAKNILENESKNAPKM